MGIRGEYNGIILSLIVGASRGAAIFQRRENPKTRSTPKLVIFNPIQLPPPLIDYTLPRMPPSPAPK